MRQGMTITGRCARFASRPATEPKMFDDAVRGTDDDRVRLVLPSDLFEFVTDVTAALDEDRGHLGQIFGTREFEAEHLGAAGRARRRRPVVPARPHCGGQPVATCTMIRPEPGAEAMPIAQARARSLDVEPSKPTTTPCLKAGSQDWRVFRRQGSAAVGSGERALAVRGIEEFVTGHGVSRRLDPRGGDDDVRQSCVRKSSSRYPYPQGYGGHASSAQISRALRGVPRRRHERRPQRNGCCPVQAVCTGFTQARGLS